MYSLCSGFYQWYNQKTAYKMVILGLDKAGKTSFLELVKQSEGQKFMRQDKIPPTVGLNLAKIEKRRSLFNFMDLGGQPVLRKIWEKYYSQCNGVIFVIDGSDQDRFDEVKQTLDKLYSDRSELVSLPVLFLINKSDHENFVGAE